jgi:PTS system ascorbate-specific IIB component
MEKNRPLRVVTACGLGTGTALYLKMVVEDILKKAGIYADVITADSSIAPTLETDIIVTALDLAEDFKGRAKAKEIVAVENYGNRKEISEKLLEAARRIREE